MTTDPHVEVVDPFAMVPEALVYSAVSGVAVKVYAALVRHGSDPANCHPGYRRLASLLCCSEPTVKRAILELEAAGWIERVARWSDAGDPDTNGYRVFNAPQGVGSSVNGGGVMDEPTWGQERPQGGVTDEPRVGSNLTPQREQWNESKGTRRATGNGGGASSPSGFDEFWTVYPLRKAKGAARRAFEKGLKKATADEIIQGAMRYRDDPARKPDFTAYPATWLNAERWTDEDSDSPDDVAYAPPDPELAATTARGRSRWA